MERASDAPSAAMTPIDQLLSPFVPQAVLVIALVAFLRYGLSKLTLRLDGWPVVGAAAVVTVLVCLWTQRRVSQAIDWTALVLDAPAVFIVAVGGTAWAQKLRSAKKSDTEDSGLAEALAEITEKMEAIGRQPIVMQTSVDLTADATPLARAVDIQRALNAQALSADDFSFAKDAEPEVPEAPPSPPAPAAP